MLKRFICLTVILALAFGFLPGRSEEAGQTEEKRIVASFYPVYVLARNLTDGLPGVTLTCMTAPTAGCLHDYQLLTGDMAALSEADAFLINGAGMESFLDTITDVFPDLPVIDCSREITLIREGAEDGLEYNAHIWLAPKNAVVMVRNMAAGLSALLPELADAITANADSYTARLEALDSEISGLLAGLEKRDIVTFHAAFPYFAQAYDLNVVCVVALEPDEPVSPKMLSQIVKTIRGSGCPPLFSEPQYQSAALTSVAGETGAPVYELDPVVTGDGAKDSYERIMLQNAQTLVKALTAR